MEEECKLDISEVKHHIVKDVRLRKMYIWDLIWELFGKHRKYIHTMSKAQIVWHPARNFSWILGRK